MPEEQRINVLEQRVSSFDGTVRRVEQKVDSIGDTLRSLVRIEERQIATNDKLVENAKAVHEHEARLKALEIAVPENLDKRLVSIETKMPGLQESRGWVVMGVLAGVGMIGAAVVHLVMK